MINFSDIFVVDQINQQKIGYTEWKLFFPWDKWHWEIRINDNGTFHSYYVKTNVSIVKESDVQGCAYAMDWNNVNVGHRYYYIVNNELRSFMGQGDEIFDFDKTVQVKTNLDVKLNGVFFVGQTKPEGRNFYDHNFYVIADRKIIYTLIPGGWGYTNRTANKFDKWITQARLKNPISASDFFNCALYTHNTITGQLWIYFGMILLLICVVATLYYLKIIFFKVTNIESEVEKDQLITCTFQKY